MSRQEPPPPLLPPHLGPVRVPPPRVLLHTTFEGSLPDVAKVVESVIQELVASGKVVVPPPYGRKNSGIDMPQDVRCEIKVETNPEGRLVLHIHLEQAPNLQW